VSVVRRRRENAARHPGPPATRTLELDEPAALQFVLFSNTRDTCRRLPLDRLNRRPGTGARAYNHTFDDLVEHAHVVGIVQAMCPLVKCLLCPHRNANLVALVMHMRYAHPRLAFVLRTPAACNAKLTGIEFNGGHHAIGVCVNWDFDGRDELLRPAKLPRQVRADGTPKRKCSALPKLGPLTHTAMIVGGAQANQVRCPPRSSPVRRCAGKCARS